MTKMDIKIKYIKTENNRIYMTTEDNFLIMNVEHGLLSDLDFSSLKEAKQWYTKWFKVFGVITGYKLNVNFQVIA